MDKFDVIMGKYHDKFNKYFPTMCFMLATDDELIKMMEDCMKSGKSAEDLYNLDYKNNVY